MGEPQRLRHALPPEPGTPARCGVCGHVWPCREARLFEVFEILKDAPLILVDWALGGDTHWGDTHTEGCGAVGWFAEGKGWINDYACCDICRMAEGFQRIQRL